MEHDPLQKLLPGESGYSLAARAHLASPYGSWKQTNLALFGRVEVRLHAMLPGHLDALAAWAHIDINQLRLQGSAHPLVAFGVGEQQKRLELMRSETTYDASEVIVASRLAANKLSFGHYLKSCPECMRQDAESYGVAYWHTVHQVQGVTACPIHHCRLQHAPAGDGGVNHQYLLPLWDEGEIVLGSDAEVRLSTFLAKLHLFLGQQTPVIPMAGLYQQWLETRGMLTKAGRIRWRYLKPELIACWSELFHWPVNALPAELSDFDYVPRLIHHSRPTHYIRHALVMAYLAKTPEHFFNGPLREANPVATCPAYNVLANMTQVLELFDAGLSMRQIAAKLQCSIGYLKTLLLRQNRVVERRRQHITQEVERGVWRKAFMGMHRQDIADFYGISVGAVEQIIQSHERLSAWRHYLVMQGRRCVNQKTLLDYMATNPDASRNNIKQACSAYMWLYKNDKDWLYKHLPPKSHKTRSGINWELRDMVVLAQLQGLQGQFKSMSDIDRALGGHGWLVGQRERFPLSISFANSKRTEEGIIFE
ncbi:TnsD family Tn7-like transposition protein [Corallincola holothuriorum]|nr:TnsD family Tn7-like transposition protein [Corallincola holothuriorum]